jgi:hypothetical protein
MYNLSILRRGTVRKRSLAFWGRKRETGEGRKEFSQRGLRRDGQRIVLDHQSEETYGWSKEVVIKVNRYNCSTRMDETNVVWTIRMLA